MSWNVFQHCTYMAGYKKSHDSTYRTKGHVCSSRPTQEKTPDNNQVQPQHPTRLMLVASRYGYIYLFDDRPEDASVTLVVDAVREGEVDGVILPLRHA